MDQKDLFRTKIKQILTAEQICEAEPMRKHTTFRVGGEADFFVMPTIAQIPEVVSLVKECELALTVIGNGSNLLVGDRGIRGVVLELGNHANALSIDPQSAVVEAEAGVLLSVVANQAARACLTGLEFAAGIPGSLGGGVYMNAGAYGGELKDVIETVTVLTRDGQILERVKEQLNLSYRHSCMMENDEIILKARLQLATGQQDEIYAKMEELKQKRIEKQPLEYPSAGSTFKRPEGYFAGKLIEDAGLRGFRIGDAQVSEKHCGFVINRGNATAADILELMKQVDEKVQQKFGVPLEPEVRILGEF